MSDQATAVPAVEDGAAEVIASTEAKSRWTSLFSVGTKLFAIPTLIFSVCLDIYYEVQIKTDWSMFGTQMKLTGIAILCMFLLMFRGWVSFVISVALFAYCLFEWVLS